MAKKATELMVRLLIRASQFGPVQRGLNQFITAYRQERVQKSLLAGFDIAEITPLEPRLGELTEYSRLNLLVPAVSQKHVFGGIETALQAFDRLRRHFAQARIIVTDEAVPEPKSGAFYSNWPIVKMQQPSPDGDHIVAAGDRWGQTLPVCANDYFMATAWWTAHTTQAILLWQQQHFPQTQARRFLYFIQDFEPGFYPWSSRYSLAQATYNHSDKTLAVINSSFLQEYLHQQGHHFVREYVHAPSLHPVLANVRDNARRFVKEQCLLVYGRPSTERNAFSVIVAALRLWVQRCPAAQRWKIYSAGESFESVDLGCGCQLVSLGKVPIETYADILSHAAVGLSIMISPHPSYPPLEMAAFGVRTITNQFADKDLARVSSYLVSVAHPDPDRLAAQLAILTADFDALEPAARNVDPSRIDWYDDFLQPGSEAWAWTAEAANDLLAT